MRLADWLALNEAEGRGLYWLSDQTGISIPNLRRYMREPGAINGRRPQELEMAKLYVATGGEISPASFYRLPDPGEVPIARSLDESALREGAAA